MTTTVEVMSPPRKNKPTDPAPLELEAAREMVRAAKSQGISLTGPDGLPKQLTKTVVEVSLEEEMPDHLGYSKHQVAGRESGNSRNGSRMKTVVSRGGGDRFVVEPSPRGNGGNRYSPPTGYRQVAPQQSIRADLLYNRSGNRSGVSVAAVLGRVLGANRG